MCRYIGIGASAFGIAALALSATAQPVTLLQVEHEALQNNLILLAQKYEVSTAEADIVTARIFPNNPVLTVVGDILPTTNIFAPSQKDWAVSLAFPIELGGKRDARIAVAENVKAAAESAFEDAVRQLLFSVQSSFYDALDAKASLQLAAENQSLLDSIVALDRVRVQANDIPASDLTRSEIAAEQTRVDFASAQINYEKAKINLQVAIGRQTIAQDFDIVGDLRTFPSVPSVSLAQAKQIARTQRPDLKALQNQRAADQANQRLQQALSVINLSISADALVQQNVLFYGSTVSLPIPLFNRNQGEIEKAAVRTLQIQKEIAASEQQIAADVETAYREYTARKSVVLKIEDSILAQAAEVRSMIGYSYKTGGTTILDFLDAQRTYNDAMISYYNALTAFDKSAAALRTAMAEPE